MSGPQARRPPIVLGGGSVMHYRWLTFTAVVSVVPAACAWAGQLLIVDDIPGTFMDITASGTILELGGDDEIVIVTTIGNEIFPPGAVVVANNGGLGFAFPPSNDLPPVNEPIPSTAAFGGGRALLPFWDDIDDKNGDVLELQTEDMLIIQWNDLILTGTGDTVTFQVQIFGHPLGGPEAVFAQILFADIEQLGPGGGASATIGYQDGGGGFGDFQWSFDTAAAVANGTVLSIVTPEPGTLVLLALGGFAIRRTPRRPCS